MKKILCFSLCIAMLISLCSCSFFDELLNEISYDGELVVHFIDVGQGDCTLLQSGDEFMLIDAGEAEYGATVCQYLKNCGVRTLSYVVATHPHSDHCGGLYDVLNTFECDNFITTETNQQTKTWLNVLDSVLKNGINYIDAKVGSTYTLGSSDFQILAPYVIDNENYNNCSVSLKVTCNNNSFLFTGDAEKEVEQTLLNNNLDLSADVIKVPHHGSSTSSSIEFLRAVSPEYAVISCGRQNDYGHPHKETMQSLRRLSVTTHRTDKQGTVVCVSDGNNIEFFWDNSDERPEVPTTPSHYIGNKNTKKFHLDSCSGATDMKEQNKIMFDTIEDALSSGYSPCQTCEP